MSNASESRLAGTLEASFGVLPAGATPKLHELTVVTADLTRQNDSVTSDRIITGAQPGDRVQTRVGGGGSLSDELSYGGMIVQIVTGQISFTSPATITGPNGTFTSVNVGDWVRVARPGSANNGYWFVTAKGGSDQTLTVVGEHGATLTTESAGSECEVAVDYEQDIRLCGVLRATSWSKAVDVACSNYFSVNGSGQLARTAISLSQTGVFAVVANKLNRNDTGGGGSWVTDGIKIGMKILIAGFATAGNNGLKTVLTVTAADIGFAESLTNEATPGGAVTVKADFISDGYEAGMLLKTSGWATSSNNDIFRITTVETNKLTFTVAMATESAPAGQVRLKGGSYILNGTHQHTFFIERDQSDVTAGLFQRGSGMYMASFGVRVDRGIAKTSWNVFGANFEHGFTATAGTGTDHPSNPSQVLNGVEHTRRLRIDDAPIGTFTTDLSLDIANGAAPREAHGSRGAIGIRQGRISGDMRVTAYYEDADLVTLNQDWTDFTASIIFDGPNGEAIAFDFLAANMLNAATPIPGNEQDCYVNASIGAKRDATLLRTLRVTRWPN